MRTLAVLLFLFSIPFANAYACPDGFIYDEIKKSCVSQSDSSVTVTKKTSNGCEKFIDQ
ncbi:MAG: hypothetical protein ACL7BU_00675 [Candidatus Phlomobacter fragariae]